VVCGFFVDTVYA